MMNIAVASSIKGFPKQIKNVCCICEWSKKKYRNILYACTLHIHSTHPRVPVAFIKLQMKIKQQHNAGKWARIFFIDSNESKSEIIIAIAARVCGRESECVQTSENCQRQ